MYDATTKVKCAGSAKLVIDEPMKKTKIDFVTPKGQVVGKVTVAITLGFGSQSVELANDFKKGGIAVKACDVDQSEDDKEADANMGFKQKMFTRIMYSAGMGGDVSKKGADMISKFLTDGPVSFKVLTFLSGASLVFSSSMKIVTYGAAMPGGLVPMFQNMWMALFGIIVLMLETNMALLDKWADNVYFYFKAVKYVWGRGIFYMFVGSMEWGAPTASLKDKFFGLILILLGTVYFVIGRATVAQLEQVGSCGRSAALPLPAGRLIASLPPS